MQQTLAFAPSPEDFDEGYFDLPVLSWSEPAAPPCPEEPEVAAEFDLALAD